jgi:hypothetical protein
VREVRWVNARLSPAADAIGNRKGDGIIRRTGPADSAHEEGILSAIWAPFALRNWVLCVDGDAKRLVEVGVEVVGISGRGERAAFAGC